MFFVNVEDSLEVVNDVVSGVSSDGFFVDDSLGAFDASSVEALSDTVAADGDTGVVVLSEEFVDSLPVSVADLGLRVLADSDGLSDVVVAVDAPGLNDYATVVSADGSVEAKEGIFNSVLNSGEGIAEDVVTGVSAMEDLSSYNPAAGIEQVDITLAVLLIGLPLVIGAVVSVVATSVLSSRSKGDRGVIESPVGSDYRGVPENIVNELKILRQSYGFNSVLPKRLQISLHQIDDYITLLFNKLAEDGTGTSYSVAEIEYVNKLRKLNELLGSKFLVDIIENKELWITYDKKKETIFDAVSAFEEEIVDNIRNVNAGKDLDFRVAVSALTFERDSIKVGDLYQEGLKNVKR